MDLDNIECVTTTTSPDGLEDEEMMNNRHPNNYPSKSHNNNNNNNNNVIGRLAGLISPATSVHELLECPVCTNSMYPPIHQVPFLSFLFCLLFFFNYYLIAFFLINFTLFIWKLLCASCL